MTTPGTRKRVRIAVANREGILAMLRTVQTGRGQNDLSFIDVMVVARNAEEGLADLKIAKRRRAGATAEFVRGGASAKAYRYPIKSTYATVKRDSVGWYLESVESVKMCPREGGVDSVALSVTQRAEVHARKTKAAAKVQARVTRKPSSPEAHA
ncbi:hypothetical protein ACELLULO517_15605 [Acidisoma cellulosilytica]|uniref:Uncharacterized protein n=1 Tax=Acidisoma cellulosilyticum TaxID=2802395 RepID=A0A964E568_9PROT|nr:hypothetical protein [Acidisoma cellulosilyticum]MCB8881673.1 hypothetical protein [Acidisoma cellulosilyticum]